MHAQGTRGTAVLHFHDEPHQRGNATSQVFSAADSRWGRLLEGEGWGPCPPDPDSGWTLCVASPALNLRYPAGTQGRLVLV